MRTGISCFRCNGPLVKTLDALKRSRLRCPTCDGVAGRAPRRTLQLEEAPRPVSAFVAESEE